MKSGKYDDEVSVTNTPHLKEKTIILGLVYFLVGVNFLLHGAVCGTAEEVILGVIFLLLVPIVVFDKRRENRGTFAVVCACIILQRAHCMEREEEIQAQTMSPNALSSFLKG
ncbi:MAG: hypothetical protein IKQ69_02740 [Oscillospiraceae bacterium]|nr:hypothetical protein [Oscillospiraceae bacterium]